MNWVEFVAEVTKRLGPDAINPNTQVQDQITAAIVDGAVELQTRIKQLRSGHVKHYSPSHGVMLYPNVFQFDLPDGYESAESFCYREALVDSECFAWTSGFVLSGLAAYPNANGAFEKTGVVDLFFGTTSDGSLPDAMVVEGAGVPEANSVYLLDGLEGGKDRYTLVGGTAGSDSLEFRSGDPRWAIYSTAAAGLYTYGSALTSVDTPDLATGWMALRPEEEPAPTVRRATWADIDAAGIDRSTVPLIGGGSPSTTYGPEWFRHTTNPAYSFRIAARSNGTYYPALYYDASLDPLADPGNPIATGELVYLSNPLTVALEDDQLAYAPWESDDGTPVWKNPNGDTVALTIAEGFSYARKPRKLRWVSWCHLESTDTQLSWSMPRKGSPTFAVRGPFGSDYDRITLEWTGIQREFDDTDVVVFDTDCARAVALFVKSEVTIGHKEKRILSREFDQKFKDAMRVLYLRMKERDESL